MAKYTGSHAAPPKHAREKAAPEKTETRRRRPQEELEEYDEVPAREHKRSARPEAAERPERAERPRKQSAPRTYEDDYEEAPRPKKKKKEKTSFGKRLGHVFLVLVALGVAACVGAAGVLMLFSHGPSEQLTKLFVRTFYSTGTKKWVPGIFMSDDEIARAQDAQADVSYLRYGKERDSIVSEVTFEEPAEDEEIIELVDVAGANWRGKMLLVRDPSLVKLSAPDVTASGTYGTFLRIGEYCEKYNAIAGITGGGFDVSVGKPSGFVILDGKVVSDLSNGGPWEMVGITSDHRLITRVIRPQDAIDMGVVEACCWSPLLITDGVKNTGLGGGYSARSCIGQRADGTMILLVIEGRSLRSLGASFQDVADFLYDQGCINAMNLDSGRSSVMVYNGENITNIAIGAGIASEERCLPNAFVVLPEGSNG